MTKVLSERENFFWVIALFLVLYLQMAHLPSMFSDGHLYATLGKNAAENGHWLIPHLSNSAYPEFFHHTPFVFIIEGVFFKIVGASYLSARVFISLFVIGTFFFLIKLFKNNKALWIGLLLITIPPLIKKSRFPNVDVPLMMASIAFYYFYSKWNEIKFAWVGCAVSFGLALLIKGPLGALIPIGVFAAILGTKNFKFLKDYRVYLSLFVSLLIFSLWPLSLKITNRFDIFLAWFQFTFIDTIFKARGAGSPFYTYFLFLIKNAPLWFGLALHGLFLKNRTQVEKESAWIFGSSVCLLSFASFKYSNYLIPIYPFMAILAYSSLSSFFNEKKLGLILDRLKYLVITAALILLIFPLTTKIRRDKEVHYLRGYFEKLEWTPKEYAIVDNAYPYWNLASLVAWKSQGEVVRKYQVDQLKSCKDCVVIVNHHQYEKVKKKLTDYKRMANLRNFNSFILVPKNMAMETEMLLK